MDKSQSGLVVCFTMLLSSLAAVSPEAAAQLEPAAAAGYKAAILCSGVFIAGRDPRDIAREELAGPNATVASLDDTAIDYETKSVRVSYAGSDTPRLAVHLKNHGTILLPPGSTFQDMAHVPKVPMPMPSGDAASIDWPMGDRLPDKPLPPEVDEAKLAEAVELAFTGEKYRPHKTLGVVIVYQGRIIAERYAPAWGVHTQYRSWSSAKSITNALVGILVGQGKLKVSDPAPIPEWQGKNDPRGRITIDHLMHMSSGLKSTGSDTPTAYWGGVDTAAEVARSEVEVPPDTRWKYSNYDTLLLVRSIKETIGDRETYMTFPRRALLNKLGMRHTFPETDPHGNFILSSQMYTTPRDLARFGMLFLNDGVWMGERILPERWVDYTKTPAPAKKTGEGWGYGAQFWLFNEDPRVPGDTYSTAGARGQLSTIVPSRDLVIARTGLDPRAGGKWDQIEFTADVLNAIGDGGRSPDEAP